MNTELQTPLTWVQIVMDLVVQSLLFIFTAYIVYLSFSHSAFLFAWHPALLTIGYTVFMSEAILSFSENNLLIRNRSFQWRVRFHWIMQTIGGVLSTAGFIAILAHKFVNDKHHFHTYHAIVGLITFILTALVGVGGVWTKYSYNLRQYLRPVLAKLIHGALGSILYFLAVITMILGLYSNFFVRSSFSSARGIGIFILIITATYVLIKPLTSCLMRFRSAPMRVSSL
ncbi:transmembrane reductase CYB561D2-like [Lutzomyia longipalpis]|uniref:transmembrane reductase CYB561D2-like n=1 Tax=Lutzomyia longipalpis TaxID=7200 RepID=UPI0024846567|nr:transmembrane reductase CYB561D2-like [Lutzomyia longipalpis]